MLTVTAGGYNARHPFSYFMTRPEGLNKYVLLIVKTRAEFTIGGRSFTAEPNSAVLIRHNIPYQYHSVKGEYVDDWLHFECTGKPETALCGLPFHEPVPLENAARFTAGIQQILWENNYDYSEYRSGNVHMLLTVLLNHVRAAARNISEKKRYSPYFTKLQSLRLSMQTQPDQKYTPASAASSLGISASYFQHLYREFFGVSFQADLISLRIDYAKEMITGTKLPLEAVAEICGYTNEVHFYRQFRKYTGMTPGAYRIAAGKNDLLQVETGHPHTIFD